MKLSDLDPNEIQTIDNGQQNEPSEAIPTKLSELDPNQVTYGNQEEYSPLETFAANAGNATVFGFGDEALGGINAARDFLNSDKSWEDFDFSKSYEENRDSFRDALRQMRKQNPKSAVAGDVFGAVAPGLLTGGASLGAQGVLRGAATATAGGAAAGAGYSEGDFGSDRFYTDTALGGLLGLLGYGAVKGGGKVIEKAKPKLQNAKTNVVDFLDDVATKRATKASTGQNIKALRDISRQPGGIKAHGRKLLDATVDMGNGKEKPLIGLVDNVDDIAKKADVKNDQISKVFDDIYNDANKLAPNAFDPDNLAMKVMDHADDKYWQPGNVNARRQLYDQADEIMKLDLMDLSKAQEIKNSYRFKQSKPGPMELNPDVRTDMKRLTGKAMDETFEEISGREGLEGIAQRYKDAKKAYGPISKTAELAEDRALKDLSNRILSPSDHAAGAVSFMRSAGDIAGGIKAAAVAFGNKQLRTRGNAFVARSTDALLKALQKDPSKLGKFGPGLLKAAERDPKAIGVAHVLLLKNDKEYQKLIGGLMEGGETEFSAKKGPPE